jgi:hypothetical protein
MTQQQTIARAISEYRKKHLQWKSDGGFNVDNGIDPTAVEDWLTTTLTSVYEEGEKAKEIQHEDEIAEPSIALWHKDGIVPDSGYKVYRNNKLANTKGKWEFLVLVNEALTQPSNPK